MSEFDFDHPLPAASALPANDQVLSQIEQFLAQLVADVVPLEPDHDGPGRPRVLPALLLWTALLVCVLRGATSRLAIWRLLASRGLWHYPRIPVSDQAVYKRLDQAGTQPLEALFGHVSALLRPRLAPYADQTLAPFASAVVALDETTLDPVARLLPSLRTVPPGADALLPGKLRCLFDLRLQQWLQIDHQPAPRQNSKLGVHEMLAYLPHGSLILADLGYFGFAWFDTLTAAGYWWVSRLRAKTTFSVLHTYYQDATTFDGLIWLGVHRADRAAQAVRLVQFQVAGRQYQYLTNVLEPQQLSLSDLARLYVRRWDIELAFKLIKQHLKLHLIWSGKQEAVMQQVWAVVIIAQILQAVRLEIAGRAGVDLFAVSVALLIEYVPQFTAQGQDGLAEFVAQGRILRFIRASSRTQVQAPLLDLAIYTPLPPNLVLTRPPRYARRNCGPRLKPPN